jgi:hypothetical protein
VQVQCRYRHGQREFWEATIYGRQLHAGDHHVSLMHTPHFIQFLTALGCELVVSCPESDQDFNTILTVIKTNKPLTYEQRINKEIFSNESE